MIDLVYGRVILLSRAHWLKSACAGWESRSPVVVGEAVAPAAAAGSRISARSEMARSLSLATDNRQNALPGNVDRQV